MSKNRLLLIAMISLLLPGCGNEKSFSRVVNPTDPNNLYCDEYERVFNEKGIYSYKTDAGAVFHSFTNYIPQDVFEKYHIGAFSTTMTAPTITITNYFIYCNNAVYEISNGGFPTGTLNATFTNFLISDINNDGYIEFSAGFALSGRVNYTALLSIDTATGKSKTSISARNVYLFFKKNNTIYQKDLISGKLYDEETLYSKIIAPPRKYHLNSTSYELEGSNFKVIISEDAEQYHFPLIYKGLSVYHWLDIEFTYLGEDMAYDSSSCYSPFENRNVAFKKGDTFLRTEVYGCWFDATDFILEKGKQYSFEYPIKDYYEEYNKKGTYDVYITFLEETVSLPDVITVK